MMVLLTSTSVRTFWRTHPDAERWLRDWLRVVERANWSSVQDVRSAYPHADGVNVDGGRTLTVFNVCGNRYRLVVEIVYAIRTIYFIGVMTHAEYDRGRWRR